MSLYSFLKSAQQSLSELGDAPDFAKQMLGTPQKQKAKDAISASDKISYLVGRVRALQEEVEHLRSTQASGGAISQSPRSGPASATQNISASHPLAAGLTLPNGENIRFDAQTARNAVVMSEIIGQPLSKRRSMR